MKELNLSIAAVTKHFGFGAKEVREMREIEFKKWSDAMVHFREKEKEAMEEIKNK